MTRDQALDRLHSELPPDAGFSLQHVHKTRAWVDYVRGEPVRSSPPQFEDDEEWLVVVLCPGGIRANYVESTAGTSLESAVASAIDKCRTWDKAGRPQVQLNPSVKPPPLMAEGTETSRAKKEAS